MQRAYREIELGLGNQCADLDFARRDREQVDLTLREHLEHLRREPRVGADSDAHDADLGDRVVVDELVVPDLSLAPLDHRHRLGKARARDGEGEVGRACVGRSRVDDHVDLDARFGDGRDDLRHGARLVGHSGQRDPRLVPVGGDAGDLVPLHIRS